MNHFGRFRVINDTADANAKTITKATFKIGTPEVLHTLVGFGQPFPTLPEQYFAEMSLEPGQAEADKVKVTIELDDGKDVTDWELKVADAILLQSVDIKVFFNANTNKYRARGTVCGWTYQFKEPGRDLS